jgi:hypothetical protein
MSKLRLILAFAFLAACGGGPGTGPVDHATAEEHCQAECEHEASCDSAVDVPDCTSSCVDDVEGVIREDVFVDVTDCVAGLECGVSDDICFEENCAPTSAHDAYEADCRAALAGCDLGAAEIDQACETDPADSSDGDTGFLCALTPEIVDALAVCFDEADCQAIFTCYDEVAAEQGIDF